MGKEVRNAISKSRSWVSNATQPELRPYEYGGVWKASGSYLGLKLNWRRLADTLADRMER